MFDLKQRLVNLLASRPLPIGGEIRSVQCCALPLVQNAAEPDRPTPPTGHLVLFDQAMLSIDTVVDDIVAWRNAPSPTYSDYSPVTRDGTLAYMKTWVEARDRAFFALLDADHQFVGHLGAIQRAADVCSFENFRRGRPGAPSAANLFFLAEVGLLDLLAACGMAEVVLQTMSYNVPLIAMHQEAGFVVAGRTPITSADRLIFRNGLPIAEDMYRRIARIEMMCRLRSAAS